MLCGSHIILFFKDVQHILKLNILLKLFNLPDNPQEIWQDISFTFIKLNSSQKIRKKFDHTFYLTTRYYFPYDYCNKPHVSLYCMVITLNGLRREIIQGFRVILCNKTYIILWHKDANMMKMIFYIKQRLFE